jgi:23S rRNA pseudouridine1911/1915/1917 synthase
VKTLWLSRDWPDLAILYEDDDLLVVNKPAGLLVVPDRWDKQKANLMGLLAGALPGRYIANAHRLDCHTTGVLLLAKSKPALVHLARQFNDRRTHKSYVAIVHGALPEPTTTIDLPIGPHPKRPGLSRIDQTRGKPSRTIARIAEHFRQHSLLDCDLLTGRQHQIRIHLQAIGCPLVGDADYGGAPLLLSQLKRKYRPKQDEPERALLDRPALHAAQLKFIQPTSGTELTVTAPWPKDLTVAVKYLRKYAQS